MKAIIKLRDEQDITCHNLTSITATKFQKPRMYFEDSTKCETKIWDSDFSTLVIIDDADYLFSGNEQIYVRGSDVLVIQLIA